MKIKKVLGKIFPVFDGEERKKASIDKIINSTQLNTGVINIHRHDLNNVGDYYCAPHLYFKELKGKYLDISDARSFSKNIRENWVRQINTNSLIIGGGGLLNLRHFEMQLKLFESLNSKGKKTVLWGPGHNAIDYKNFNNNRTYNVDVSKFGIAGTRDYSMSNEWVPCVSCLHPIFDTTFETLQEVGVLFGKKSTKNHELKRKLNNYPISSNMTSIEEMVSFIGKSETIVTDSYHAMYWAMLLGKRTVVVPTTSKFFDFKYQPVISSFENFENDINKARSYSGVLEECREVNTKFAEKVFNYLNL